MIKNDDTNFFYSALMIIGGLFAVYNIIIGIRYIRDKSRNKDYAELLKENAALKRRNEEMQKLIL